MRKDDGKRAISNYITSILSYLTIIIIGLIVPRYFTLNYGSEVNGLISSVNQYVEYLGLFEAGIGVLGLQALYRPLAKDDRRGISSVVNATGEYYRKAGLFYFIGLVILCFVYPLVFDSGVEFFKVSCIIFFSGLVNVANFWIQGRYVVLLKAEGKSYIVSNLTTISTILTGALKILLIWLRADIVIIMASAFVVSLLTMMFILLYIKANYKWLDKSAEPDYKAIGQKNYVLIKEISWLIFNNTDIVILSYFCGFKVVSVYTMYKIVVNQLNNLVDAIPNSVSFSLGRTYNTDIAQYRKSADIVESLYSTVYHTVFSVTLFLFVPFMRLYTSGITDINYVDYKLAVLFVCIELLNHGRGIMNQAINIAGHFKLTTSRTIAESVINIVTSLIAVHFWGIYGVLAGTVAALLYRTNDIIIYSNRRILGRSPLKTYCIHAVNLVLLIGFQFIYRLLIPSIESYLTFAAYGAIMVLMTGFVMFMAQIILFPDFRNTVADGLGKVLGKLRKEK